MISKMKLFIDTLKLRAINNERLFKRWQTLSIEQKSALWDRLSNAQQEHLIGVDESLFGQDQILVSQEEELECDWNEEIWANDDSLSIAELNVKWDALTEHERDEIYADFQSDCFDGAREPCLFWYPLLMPRVMKGYCGD